MTPVIIFGAFLIIILFTYVYKKVWTEPHNEIKSLKKSIEKLTSIYRNEIFKLTNRLNNLDVCDANIVSSEFADIIIDSAWREIIEANYPGIKRINDSSLHYSRYNTDNIKVSMKKRFQEALNSQYKYQFITFMYPQLKDIFIEKEIDNRTLLFVPDMNKKIQSIVDVVDIINNSKETGKQLIALKNKVDLLEASTSNLKAIPYMAAIMADFETYGIEILAKELDWGYSYERKNKIKAIREIRKDATEIVERNKDAQYKLAYLISMFPALEDVLDSEYSQLPNIQISDLSEYDKTKDYLSKDEYQALSTAERNQLALDRYKASRNKTKWQIGRDYELYIGHLLSQKGYLVDYFGSYMGFEDLGRDLIAKKDNKVIIVQCKYWSAQKTIHEKHILQLYGTMVSYCFENNINQNNVGGILCTNIKLSDTAKKMADYLKVKYQEEIAMGDYPCIKCNIGHDDYLDRKIYHLPFDQQYDYTKISKPGEFFALTVEEAEKAGFRRAMRWKKD